MCIDPKLINEWSYVINCIQQYNTAIHGYSHTFHFFQAQVPTTSSPSSSSTLWGRQDRRRRVSLSASTAPRDTSRSRRWTDTSSTSVGKPLASPVPGVSTRPSRRQTWWPIWRTDIRSTSCWTLQRGRPRVSTWMPETLWICCSTPTRSRKDKEDGKTWIQIAEDKKGWMLRTQSREDKRIECLKLKVEKIKCVECFELKVEKKKNWMPQTQRREDLVSRLLKG